MAWFERAGEFPLHARAAPDPHSHVMAWFERAGRRIVRGMAGWWRCSWPERGRFFVAATAIPAMHIAVRVWSFRSTLRWLGRATPGDPSSLAAGALIGECANAMRRARVFAPFAGNCLSQSLALYWMLTRRGVPAEICVGARMDDGRLAAHAWIEVNGEVINDAADVRQRYAPFRSSRPDEDQAVWL